MTVGADRKRGPRAPTLLDAFLPVVVLIALIALTIVLFGISATDGPLQVALLLSAAFAGLTAICAVVGMVTGSSWTTAGTLGVAFVGMSKVMGLSEAAAAGAVICGAYFGDKMTPLSETTILVPKLVGRGLTTGQHTSSTSPC